MSLWKRLLFGAAPTRSSRSTPRMLRKLSLETAPAATYAVGDIHGRFDLYKDLEARILDDARAYRGPVLIVLLGDMIDRGPQSAQLLDHLRTPTPDGITRLCLRGNHEDMFIRVLNDPAGAADWISWGGAQTLASYGVHPDPEGGYDFSPTGWRKTLATSIPQSHRAFLRDMPLCLSLPDWFFSHTGINPDRDIDDQRKDDLVWGDPTGLDGHRFAQCVIHGHVPVDTARIGDKVINVDTGAYFSGVLTAVRLVKGQPAHLITTTPDTPDTQSDQ